MATSHRTTLFIVSSTRKNPQQSTTPEARLLQAARSALAALELKLGESSAENVICQTLRLAIAGLESPNPPNSPAPAVRCAVSYSFGDARSNIAVQCKENAFVTCEHCGPICLTCLANVNCAPGHQHKFSSSEVAA